MHTGWSIGNVMGTAFRIWFKNLIPFLLITVVVYSPLIIWGVIVVGGDDPTKLEAYNDNNDLIIILLNYFTAAAITYGVVMELQGQHAPLGACFATGLLRFFPVLGVGFLTILCIIGGFIALIIPGLIVLCMLYVATPAAVLERPGIIGALKRSRELTQGHKMEIFGIILLLGCINFGVTILALEILVGVETDARITEIASSAARTRFMYTQLALNVLIGSLSAVMSAVAYYYLRNEKEGTSAQELAKVFE